MPFVQHNCSDEGPPSVRGGFFGLFSCQQVCFYVSPNPIPTTNTNTLPFQRVNINFINGILIGLMFYSGQ